MFLGQGTQQRQKNYSEEEKLELSIYCMSMAVTMYNQKNDELIELAVKSSDPTHRIAAAWAISFATIPHEDGQHSLNSFKKYQMVVLNQKMKNKSFDEQLIKSYQRLSTISGLKKHKPVSEINGCIYNLLADSDPLVILAAREACKQIAKSLFGDSQVDFGPSYNGQGEGSKKDAVDMWQSYFEKSLKDNKENVKRTEASSRLQRRKAAQAKKSVAETLGIKDEEK